MTSVATVFHSGFGHTKVQAEAVPTPSCEDVHVRRVPSPQPGGGDPVLDPAAEMLDPVLAPLGFAPAQGGVGADHGQVIFCRGFVDSVDDGCVDLVIDFEEAPEWHIVAVRYWGFPADRWQLDFPREGALVDQLSRLAETLPFQLG